MKKKENQEGVKKDKKKKKKEGWEWVKDRKGGRQKREGGEI